MFENWKKYCCPRELKAYDWLEEPWDIPGMRTLIKHEPCVQLFTLHSFHPYCSWTVFRDPKDHARHLVRRARWDQIRDHQLGVHIRDDDPPTFYGSDVLVPSREVEQRLDELAKIQLPAFAMEDILGIDGVTFGVRRMVSGRSAELTWWGPPPAGWEALAHWHAECVEWLESQLPAHTDRLGHSATRPWGGDTQSTNQ